MDNENKHSEGIAALAGLVLSFCAIGVVSQTAHAADTETRCISTNLHQTWYGLRARECKANDASGAKFTVFNPDTGKAVAKVNLKNVKLPPIGKTVTLGCVVSAIGFALSIPGTPTDEVGWMLKGAQLLVGAAGIALSC